MSAQPLRLSAAQAVAFRQAFDDRETYIADQPWQIRMAVGFEDTVPYPGCPHCWRDAERTEWHVFEHEMWTIINPCGHWFTTETPITVRRSGPGWIREEEWLP
ncbi:hypothetical protein [Streptomyces sp. NPDC057877]|uniref:hypothetical protein n=1 Tax=Streptomyces sp. NPDC057877 TaxID=3346269 RepID=UPI0036CC40EB